MKYNLYSHAHLVYSNWIILDVFQFNSMSVLTAYFGNKQNSWMWWKHRYEVLVGLPQVIGNCLIVLAVAAKKKASQNTPQSYIS